MRMLVPFLLSTLAFSQAQDSPLARNILRSVEDASRSVRAIRSEFETTVKIGDDPRLPSIKTTGTIVVQPPDKLRAELQMSGMQVLVIQDGENGWAYDKSTNTYSRLPAAPSALMAMASFGLGAGIAEKVGSMEMAPEESVTVGGESIPCYVIRTNDPATPGVRGTLWIDKSRFVILRTRISSQSEQSGATPPPAVEMQVTRLTFDPPITGAEFVFIPPEGARETKDVVMPGMALPSGPPRLPEPPPPGSTSPQRIRIGGNVAAASLIRKVTPVYPAEAREARVQGVVKFSVVIGKDGLIQELNLISGHPMLADSAREAVRQWVYKPSLLNGQPVEVITQIDVNFVLNE